MDDTEKKLKKEKFLEERLANTMKALPHSEALSAEEKAKYQKALLPLLQSALGIAPPPQAETMNWGLAAKHSSVPPQAGFDYSASYSIPSTMDFPFAPPTPAPPLPQPPLPQDQFLTSLGTSKTPLRIEPFPSPLQKKKKPTPPPAKPIPEGFGLNLSYGGRKKILDDPYQNPLNQKLAPWIKAKNLMGQNQGILPNAPWSPQNPSPAQKLEQKLKNVEKLMGEFEEKILEAQNSGDLQTELQYKKYLSGLESQWMALRGGNFDPDPKPNPFEGGGGKDVMFLRPLPLPKGDRLQEEEPDKPQEKKAKPFIGPALLPPPKKLILSKEQSSVSWLKKDEEDELLLVQDNASNSELVFSDATNSSNTLNKIYNDFEFLSPIRELVIEYSPGFHPNGYSDVIEKVYIISKDDQFIDKFYRALAEGYAQNKAKVEELKNDKKWMLRILINRLLLGTTISISPDELSEKIDELLLWENDLDGLGKKQKESAIINFVGGKEMLDAIHNAKVAYAED
jgi:hypothetical protein